MLPTLSPRRHIDRVSGSISAFESETLDVIRQTAPYSEHAILHVVAGMLFLALVMMSIVKLDRVVTGTGIIMPVGGSFFVSPLDRAIVTAVLVHPGDVVKKDQVLATLDPTFAAADYNALVKKVSSDKALADRLQAEQDKRPFIANPGDNKDQQLQASIWRQRQMEYQQAVANYDEQINSNNSVMQKARDDAKNDRTALGLNTKLQAMQQDLAKKGWGSEALLLTAQNTTVQTQKQLEEDLNTVTQSQHNMASLEAQKQTYINTWFEQVGTQLTAAKAQYDADYDTLVKDQKTNDLSKLVAPQDAVVLNINNASQGAVIDPSTSAQPLMTLTPINDRLEAEVDVPSADVGFIRVGDHATLKLDAFEYTQHGTVSGVVKSISEGSFQTNAQGQPVPPYFKALVTITGNHLKNVPKDFRIVPGMTLSGDILIGGRTMMDYIITGGLRTTTEAMREPQ